MTDAKGTTKTDEILKRVQDDGDMVQDDGDVVQGDVVASLRKFDGI